MTQYPDLFAALAAPFHPDEIRTRTQAGRQLSYITARIAMNRLDTVCGPENWWDAYSHQTDASVMCCLTIRLPDGQELTKSDCGGAAGMADAGDDEKSAVSDGFKRACAKFGVGRYLYGDGIPCYAQAQLPVPASKPPPKVRREWASRRPTPEPEPAAVAANGHGNGRGEPRNGRALFAWTKDQEQRHGVGLLKYLNTWGKLQEFPARMVDWNADQVGLAYAEARRKLASIEGGGDE